MTIIGNLTKDPVARVTPNGTNVCSFTVAVNERKGKNKEQTATFFDVSAWNQLSEVCAKFLKKGSKVCVIGPVSLRTYDGNDGKTRANLSVNANEIEFLSSRQENDAPPQQHEPDNSHGTQYADVTGDVEDDLPF